MKAEIIGVILGTLLAASAYALAGVGFVILFRATRVLNFAQGALMTLGGLIFYSLAVTLHLGLALGLGATCAAMAIIGWLIYYVIFSRVGHVEVFMVIIGTLGLAIIVETVYSAFWGVNARYFPSYFGERVLNIGFPLPKVDLFVLVFSACFLAALYLFLHRSRYGLRMRAVAERPVLAARTGIRVSRVSAAAWALCSVCGAVGAVIYALPTIYDPTTTLSLGSLALPAIIIGGLDSVGGAVVGSVLVALLQNVVATIFGGIWSDLGAYCVLILVIIVWPSGLFGSRDVVRL